MTAPDQPVVQPSPLLQTVHGAVQAEGLDAGTAAHYGDPLREQRALERGRAVVDQSQRGVLTVEGPDRLSWLTTLSSQVLTGLRPGDSAETLFLDVQGRIEHAPHVLDDGQHVWLITEAAEREPLRAWLESMRFALRVEVADRSAEAAVIAGTDLPEGVRRAAGQLGAQGAALIWTDPWPGVAAGGWGYAQAPEHPGGERAWQEAIVPRVRLAELLSGPEAPALAGAWAAEALRIAAWRPRLGAETDDRAIPHELDWMRTAVHLAKGCYKGQETIARVHNLGHPPRRLALLDLDGSEHTLPPAGAEVLAGQRRVGRVTSVQLHHEQGPIALAVLKRSVDTELPLRVREAAPEPDAESGESAEPAEWAAAQTVIVPPEAGQAVQREKGFLRRSR